ncbi:MAG: GTPase ObgE [Flavobacteriaceae bacterium]
MTEDNFVDYVSLNVISGNGGRGSSHLRREKFVAKGGPDGGDGGNGGDVIFRGDANIWTLYTFKFKKHFKAGHGGDGGRNKRTGKKGEDIIIKVPLGTTIIEKKSHKLLAEITENNKEIILIRGGLGGRGNCYFKSSTNRTPRYSQNGISGEEMIITLELKILADVGLVGFPNAGKSTLLASITSAKPKIGDYEFTTLKPNLGIVEYKDFKTFVVADIPGIIEGASSGKGLGHYFLRHIERNSILLFLISAEHEIYKRFLILREEMLKFNPELLDKKFIVVISKIDLIEASKRSFFLDKVNKDFKSVSVLALSSVINLGLNNLKDELWKVLNSAQIE